MASAFNWYEDVLADEQERKRLRAEEDAEWEEDDFVIIRRREINEPQRPEGLQDPDLSQEDDRFFDPWFRLGSLLWDQPTRTRSQGDVEDFPLPDRCLTSRGRGRPRASSSATPEQPPEDQQPFPDRP